MAEQITGPDGRFSLDGASSDLIGDIDPALKIIHECKVSKKWVLLFYADPGNLIFKIYKVLLFNSGNVQTRFPLHHPRRIYLC